MASVSFPLVCPSATHALTTKNTDPATIRCRDLIWVTPSRLCFSRPLRQSRCAASIGSLSSSRGCLRCLGQRQRGLTKNVSPALCSSYVGVAVPQRPLKGFPTVATLSPQLSGDHSGVAPDTYRLLKVFLMFVMDAPALGLVEQIRLSGDRAVALNQDEIVG